MLWFPESPRSWLHDIRLARKCTRAGERHQNAAIQATSGKIEPKHVFLRRTSTAQTLENLPDPHEGFSLEGFLTQIRSQLYSRGSRDCPRGNSTKAAKLLGLTPQAVCSSAENARMELQLVKSEPELAWGLVDAIEDIYKCLWINIL